MKSKKAFKYLQSTAMHPNSPLAKDQDFVWRDNSIIHAIELAEQEAEERHAEDIDRYKKDLKESKHREELACKVIADQRNEIEELRRRESEDMKAIASIHEKIYEKICTSKFINSPYDSWENITFLGRIARSINEILDKQ